MSAILGLLSDRKLGSLDFQGLYAGNNSILSFRFKVGYDERAVQAGKLQTARNGIE
jgi:hypothetical protein